MGAGNFSKIYVTLGLHFIVGPISGGDLAPSLGDGKIFRGPRFLNDVFLGTIKFPFSRPKFLMTFFSHSPGFSDFPFLFPDFSYLYCVCRRPIKRYPDISPPDTSHRTFSPG